MKGCVCSIRTECEVAPVAAVVLELVRLVESLPGGGGDAVSHVPFYERIELESEMSVFMVRSLIQLRPNYIPCIKLTV